MKQWEPMARGEKKKKSIAPLPQQQIKQNEQSTAFPPMLQLHLCTF